MLICQHRKSRSRKHGPVAQSEGSRRAGGAVTPLGVTEGGMLPICRRLSNESPYEVQPYTPSDTFGETSPLHAGRLTLCRFCIWNSSASGHATAPTRKNDRAYRPSSVCPSGSHLPPGEGIPQMGRYTFTLSNRTPSTLTSGLREKFRERGKIEVEFMGVLCYDNAVSIWACCALK